VNHGVEDEIINMYKDRASFSSLLIYILIHFKW